MPVRHRGGEEHAPELLDGRSQPLAYIMFGPDCELGACAGCTNPGDGLDGTIVHLNHRDVTLNCSPGPNVDAVPEPTLDNALPAWFDTFATWRDPLTQGALADWHGPVAHGGV